MWYKVITSKDYLYISVRYYGSKHHAKNENFQTHAPAMRSFNKAFDNYRSLIHGLFLKVAGENTGLKLQMTGNEVLEEIIHEATGIKICNAAPTQIFCIPKSEIGYELFSWIQLNCKCKFKVLKRTCGTYMDRGVSHRQREMNLRSIIWFKDNVPDLE